MFSYKANPPASAGSGKGGICEIAQRGRPARLSHRTAAFVLGHDDYCQTGASGAGDVHGPWPQRRHRDNLIGNRRHHAARWFQPLRAENIVHDANMREVSKGAVIFVIAMLICIAILAAFPKIATFLPNLMLAR